VGFPLRTLSAALEGLFYAAYPLVVYVAHTRFGTRGVGGLLLLLYTCAVLLRVRANAAELWPVLRQHLPLAALIAAGIALDDRRLLLLLPVVVSAYLFGTFAWSLRHGPPMIERFARLVEADLPAFTLPYCRATTILWSVFLAANAAVVAILATSAPLSCWAIYTGPCFYALVGLLLGGEFCFRKWWFRYYGDGWVDRLLERAFPPERTANGRRSLAYVERRRAAASPQ
jgi:uncharacterized membrane protein